MDAQRITEIRARAEAATPGPWAIRCDEDAQSEDAIIDPRGDTVVCCGYYDGPYLSVLPVDGEFMAHAREDIPWLLARIAELEARLEKAVGTAEGG